MDNNIKELLEEKKSVEESFSDEIENKKLDLSDAETRLRISLNKIDEKIRKNHESDERAKIELLRMMNHHFTINNNVDLFSKDLQTFFDLFKYCVSAPEQPKYKVALLFICLNPVYWQYAPNVIAQAREKFIPWHNVDYFLWTDIPKKEQDIADAMYSMYQYAEKRDLNDKQTLEWVNANIKNVADLNNRKDVHFIKTEPADWPLPTLMRYHKFLDAEQILEKYDYVFYCDIDMAFVDLVGDEILGEKLTIAPHPMYAFKHNLYPPTEPNPASTAYIKYPGFVDLVNKKFDHYYSAGGFQGGKRESFMKACRVLSKNISEDYNKGYIARWNDESHWNRYLYDYPEEVSIRLTPSYIYPDSLIKEYYEPIWGRSYHPKLVTLTKKAGLMPITDEHKKTMDQSKLQ